MGIRGFGTIFGEQQTGDVGNVGIDLFFEMLFESLSKVFSLFMSFVHYFYLIASIFRYFNFRLLLNFGISFIL